MQAVMAAGVTIGVEAVLPKIVVAGIFVQVKTDG